MPLLLFDGLTGKLMLPLLRPGRRNNSLSVARIMLSSVYIVEKKTYIKTYLHIYAIKFDFVYNINSFPNFLFQIYVFPIGLPNKIHKIYSYLVNGEKCGMEVAGQSAESDGTNLYNVPGGLTP